MHFEGTHRDTFLQTVMPSLEQCAATGGQFLEAKGFPQNVIGTFIQQSHHRIGTTAGCPHDHWTTQLISETESGSLIENLSTYKKVRRLLLAKLKSFSRPSDSSGEVTVLAESLNKDGAQGGVRLHDENPGWLLPGARLGRGQRISAGGAGFGCQVAWWGGH